MNGEGKTRQTKPDGDAWSAPTHRWLVLALLCTAQLMVVLDATIVNLALPAIQRDLGFSGADLQWIINGYVLTFGGLLLLGGRAADLFVRRNVFVAGLVVFVVASLLCGLSGSQGMLIAGRVAQGVGAALMSSAALSILLVTFTGRERNLALGVWSAISGAASAVGVILGGALTSGPGWEWVFFINVPIGLAAIALSLRFVATHRAQQRPSLDPLGALTATAGIGLLIFAIVRTEQAGWDSASTLAGLAGALFLLVLFVVVESRHPKPLVPLGVFRLRNVSGGNASAFLLGTVTFSMYFFVTLYMQRILGYSAIGTGIAYLPNAFATILAATLLAPRLVSRFGLRPALTTGMALLAAGFVWLAQIDAAGSYVTDVLLPSVVWGVGFGIVTVSVFAVATQDLSGEEESGLGSGLVNTALQVGGALGLAVLSTIAFAQVDDTTAGAPGAMALALTEGFQLAFYVGAGFAAIGIVVALLVVSGQQRGGKG